METRTSAPVRIPRDRVTRESDSTRGLYPVGEGAGYAGGIMTAAVDGVAAAEAVVQQAWQEHLLQTGEIHINSHKNDSGNCTDTLIQDPLDNSESPDLAGFLKREW